MKCEKLKLSSNEAIHYELISTIIWLLGYGVHQLSTNKESNLYSLAFLPVVIAVFLRYFVKLEENIHNAVEKYWSKPASTISIILPVLFILQQSTRKFENMIYQLIFCLFFLRFQNFLVVTNQQFFPSSYTSTSSL